jgi:hypothetical protein
MPTTILTEGEVEALLQEARKDPNHIMKIVPKAGGMQMYTNSKPFGKPEHLWLPKMDERINKGLVKEISPGLAWQLVPV